MGFGITTGKTVSTVLKGDGWYPDISVAEFLTLYRLPAEYAEELLADHLELARIWAATQLAAWRAAEEPKGGGLPLEQRAFAGIPGAGALLYKRAVHCRAKALLLQQFATIERRPEARSDPKEAPETAEAFIAQAREALAALTGRTFIGVGLL